jgi:hypothetical protein
MKSDMRVVLYTDDPSEGGVAVYTHALACGLARSGCPVTVVQSQAANPMIDEQKKLGVRHCWLPFNTLTNFSRTMSQEADAEAAYFATRPDVILFANCDPFSNLAAKAGAVKKGIPFVIVEGYVFPPAHLRDRARLLPVLENHYQQAKAVVAVSLENLDLLHQGFRYFRKEVFPILTPLKVDRSHPFPFISNLSTSLGILQRAPETPEPRFARVRIPQNVPYWLGLPASEDAPGLRFVRLLDVIGHHLDELFPGMEVLEVVPFRVTRNVEVEVDEDEAVDSFTDFVEEELRQRRLEDPVRLEYAAGASRAMLTLLSSRLRLLQQPCGHAAQATAA